jgi:hypothetical protein
MLTSGFVGLDPITSFRAPLFTAPFLFDCRAETRPERRIGARFRLAGGELCIVRRQPAFARTSSSAHRCGDGSGKTKPGECVHQDAGDASAKWPA